ncbi:MAG: succinate dehydrogenase assembly factor 2 [Ghiorsea sp.]
MNKDAQEQQLRCLQYRLKRQGMLELDVWLSPLQDALTSNNEDLLACVESLLNMEVPELIAMQKGQTPIPKELNTWLSI